MKKLLLALLFLPAVALAYPLDGSLGCDRSPHDFVAPLIEQHVIDERPHVDQRSLNTFEPLRGSHLTAFQYKVISVAGFQPDDTIFGTTSGATVAPMYGVIVFGSPADVQTSLNTAGYSRARVAHVGPHMTAIICPAG